MGRAQQGPWQLEIANCDFKLPWARGKPTRDQANPNEPSSEGKLIAEQRVGAASEASPAFKVTICGLKLGSNPTVISDNRCPQTRAFIV